MGNHHCPTPQPIRIAPPQIRVTKQRDKDVKAVRSVSNPSLVSQQEAEEEQIEVNISQQFNGSYMDMMYQKYQTTGGTSDLMMPPEVIKSITNVFDTICMDENITYLAMKIAENITRFDDTWSSMFGASAERNPLKYAEGKGFATENRIVMHAMMVFRTLKVITAYIEEGNMQQVINILDLIALSHIVMKVQPVYFRAFLVSMIKNLLHFKVITDELLPGFVNFNMNVLMNLEQRMHEWERQHVSLLNQMFDGPSAPAREYYRELKKWRTYVLSCYKYLAKPLISLEKQSHSAHKFLQSTTVEETKSYENWKLIRCLKKGYKYRPNVEKSTK